MRFSLGAILAALLLPATGGALAQTIHVDAAPDHAVNQIRPSEAMGAALDRLSYGAADKLFNDATLDKILAAGWQPITYRQNTELHAEAWHWNPQGRWSDPAGQGYFVGSAEPGPEPIVHSYGYPLPHRGVTRDDGTDASGYSRLTDGDPSTYWKSNPYLTHAYTGEDDSLHPQWVLLDLATRQAVTALVIDWADPFATDFVVQYWTGDDPIRKPTAGVWQSFPGGAVTGGKGGRQVIELSAAPMRAQWVRILMSHSSETCDDHGPQDRRNCMGYAIRELQIGTRSADGRFHDLVRHVPDQDQTATYCSSIDPWHRPADLDEQAGDQVGFDRFFTSKLTRGLPAMIPISMIYSTPEDAAAEIAYIEKRGYKISYVEMGEESDGHYTPPEDDAALYLQFAAALRKVDPGLKLGGPVFTGQNEDVETWPDAQGEASWTRRFLAYLRQHGKLGELSFFSFEHYPAEAGKVTWSSLYDEADRVTHIMQVWRDDGVPPQVPLFITESNIAAQDSEAFMDILGGLWLADYAGAFLSGGGKGLYYFHIMPKELSLGFNRSPGTFGFYSAYPDYRLGQPLSQFFASQMINLEWLQPGDGLHMLHPAVSDLDDGAGHILVTAYAVKRPDGTWALMLVNKDQDNDQTVAIAFDDKAHGKPGAFSGRVEVTTFGKAQYQWHPDGVTSNSDPNAPVQTRKTAWSTDIPGGSANPDEPPAKSTLDARASTRFTLPAASVTVIRGRIAY